MLAAGVDLGGLAPEEARQKLADALAALMRPLEVQLGDQQITLKPDEIGFELALSEMLDQAQAAKPGARVPLAVRYDEAKLRAALAGLAKQDQSAPSISVITSTDTFSRSFAVQRSVNIPAQTYHNQRRHRRSFEVENVPVAGPVSVFAARDAITQVAGQ